MFDDGAPHTVESRFQFAPGEVVIKGASATTSFPDANVRVSWDAAAWADARVISGYGADLPWEQREGWYSDGYNLIEPAPLRSLGCE